MNNTIKYISYFIISFILFSFIGNKILLEGINRFYGLNQHSDLLLIGHSHLMLAVDKNKIEKETGLKISKYTREGVGVEDRFYMVKQYLDSKYSDSLKIVFYGVDQFTFVKEGLSSNSYQLFYPFMGDTSMDNFIKKESKSEREYYSHKYFPMTRYSDALINASLRGWRSDFSNYKQGNLDIDTYREQIKSDKQFNRPLEINKDLFSVFNKTIKMITEKGIQVVLINTPVVNLLNDANKDSYKQIIQTFQEYADSNDLVEYLDFNPQYSTDYSIFFDPIHLNPKGQAIITDELIEFLNTVKE